MNISSRQVAKSSTALEVLVSAMRAQMATVQPKIGISVPLMSCNICCRFESMLARYDISASLAKSEGWKVWLITGIVIQREASLMLEP